MGFDYITNRKSPTTPNASTSSSSSLLSPNATSSGYSSMNHNHVVNNNHHNNQSNSNHRDHSLPRNSSSAGGSGGGSTPSSKSSNSFSDPTKYILRAHLPNDQRTTVQIKYPNQTVFEALEKAMHRRQLDATFCFVYVEEPRGKTEMSWDMKAADLVGLEVHVAIDETANPMLTQTRISHTYRKITLFRSNHNCSYCNKSLFFGFKCQACLIRFHHKCAKHVPALCSPKPTRSDIAAAEKIYYQNILAGNREATYVRISHCQAQVNATNLVMAARSRSSVSDMASSSGTSSIKRKAKPRNLNFGLSGPGSAPTSSGLSPRSGGKKSSNHLEPPQPPGHGRERSTSEPNVNVNLVFNNPSSASYVQNLINAQNKVAAGQDPGIVHNRTSSIHRPRARSADESSKKKIHRSSTKEDWEIPFEEILLGPRIGAGSFGTVYQGHWHGQVALKKLKVANPTEAQLQEFKNELAILQKTRHVNVILYMGCVREPDLYIVTQWCEGSSLYKHIHVIDTEFQPIQLCEIARQTAQGMDYLHSKSIIHRDLKSNNIFLHNDFTVKIGDFGMATVKTTTPAGGACGGGAPKNPTGSVLWMAPEILRMDSRDPKDPYTLQSDVYAFGVVLYELGTGELPYPGRTRDQIMYSVGRGWLKPELHLISADMPKAFHTLAKECISYIVEKRPLFPQIVTRLAKTINRIPKIERARSEPFLQMHRSPTDDYISAAYCPSPKTPINSSALTAQINSASFPFHGTINI